MNRVVFDKKLRALVVMIGYGEFGISSVEDLKY